MVSSTIQIQPDCTATSNPLIFNDWTFRHIRLANGISVLLINADNWTNSNIGLTIRNAGTLTQSKDMPPYLPKTVAFAVQKRNEEVHSEETGPSNLRDTKRSIEFEVEVAADSTTFFSTVRNTLPGIKAVLEGLTSMLSTPTPDTFPDTTLDPIYKTLIESRDESFLYDEHNLIDFLRESFSDPQHPYSNCNLNIGNKETDHPPLRESVLNYFNQHYSNTFSMNAVLQSSRSLDELQKVVEDTLGSLKTVEIQPEENDNSYKSKSPFLPLQSKLCIVPLEDTVEGTLYIEFPIVVGARREQIQPALLYTLSAMNEGSGPLLKVLRDEKGWIRVQRGYVGSLEMVSFTPYDGLVLLQWKLKLTDEGMRNMDQVVAAIFSYMGMMEKFGIEKFKFRELQDKRILQSRQVLYYYMQNNWVKEALGEMACGGGLDPILRSIYGRELQDFEQSVALIEEVLGLLVPARVKIYALSSLYKGKETGNICGIKYLEELIPHDTLEMWEQCRASADANHLFEIPSPDPIFPSAEVTLESMSFEERIMDESVRLIPNDFKLSKVWFQRNDELAQNMPQVYVRIKIYSRAVLSDAKSKVLNQLYSFLLDDFRGSGFITNFSELPSGLLISGMDWYATTVGHGIQEIFKYIVSYIPEEKPFKKLRNTFIGNQTDIIESDGAWVFGKNGEILCPTTLLPRDNRDALKETTYEDMKEFIEKFLKEIRLTWLFYGSITEQNAIFIVEECEKIFLEKGAIGIMDKEIVRDQQVLIPEGTKWSYNYETEAGPEYCAIFTMHFQNAEWCSHRRNVMIEFIASLLWETFYENLRTEDSLGFTLEVNTDISNSPVKVLTLALDSTKKDQKFWESKMEGALQDFGKTLRSMDESEYLQRRDYFVKKLWNPSIYDKKVEKYLNEILSESFCFDRNEKEAKELLTVGLDEFITFYEEFVGITPGKLRRISLSVGKMEKVEGVNEGESELEYVNLGGVSKQISNLRQWMGSLSLVPED